MHAKDTEENELIGGHQLGATRILIVASDARLARSLRSSLAGHKYVVDVSIAGRGAYVAYDRMRPQMVLLDFDQAKP